jgi:hypothetical protein
MSILQNWRRRASSLTSGENEEEFLTEILSAKKTQKAELKSLAQMKECPVLIRCAALDQYLMLILDTSKKSSNQKELRDTKQFLRTLANFETEPKEDVRAVAGQWFAELLTDHPSLSHGKSPETAKKEWRELLQNDPSPRIQSLAMLGHIENSTIVIGKKNVVQRGKYNVNINKARGSAIGDNARVDYGEDDD